MTARGWVARTAEAMRWIWHDLRRHLRPFRRSWPVAAVLAVAVVSGLVADLLFERLASPTRLAERALTAGDLPAAERHAWRALSDQPFTIPELLDFLELHEILGGGEGPAPVVSDAQMSELLARPELPEGTARIARYWRAMLRSEEATDLELEMTGLADRDPPLPWANHVLGRVLQNQHELAAAARRFEREGLRPGGPPDDLERSLRLRWYLDDHEALAERLSDERFREAAPRGLAADLAFRDGRWSDWLIELWPSIYLRGSAWGWLLATLAAGLWAWFCLRLGSSPWLGLVAFLLGVLSIYLTHVLIDLEQHIPALQPSGEIFGDAIFYVLGVGLREELAKMVLFLPLLPMILRRRQAGDGLVLGALVGLGFAAIENVDYIAAGDLATGLARFLTANFLHMSLTGIVAHGITEAARGGADAGPKAVNTFFIAVILHGLYDLFLSCPELADMSFLAMTTFVVCAQLFLRAAPLARARRGIPLVQVVVWGLVLLSATSFVYGSAMAGPQFAFLAIAEGLLGVILILVVFHRELT